MLAQLFVPCYDYIQVVQVTDASIRNDEVLEGHLGNFSYILAYLYIELSTAGMEEKPVLNEISIKSWLL